MNVSATSTRLCRLARVPLASSSASSASTTSQPQQQHSNQLTPSRHSWAAARGVRTFATTSSALATYGFVGLGKMGYPMAQQFRAKLPSTDTLVVYDAKSEVMDKFAREEANKKGKAEVEMAPTARDLAVRSEVVVTALPDGSHVRSLFYSVLNPELPPLEGSEHKRRLFIDCSTIDPNTSRSVANAVHSTRQGRFVDAPMSGGVVGARGGTLTFMLGAHEKHASDGLIEQRVTPILSLMGERVLHLGGQGAGLSAKLANNYLLAVANIATAEAMNLGVRCGLDARGLAGLINSSSGRSWTSEVNNPVAGVSPGAPAERDYEGGFGLDLMQKDLSLAIAEGDRVAAKTELGGLAAQIYEKVKEVEAGKDFSVVYKWLQETASSVTAAAAEGGAVGSGNPVKDLIRR